jgi:hypothetical protein
VVGRLAFCLTLLFRSSPRIRQHRPQLGESSQHLRVLLGAAAVAGDALLGDSEGGGERARLIRFGAGCDPAYC